MAKKTAKLIRVGVFILLFFILLSITTTILKPKWYRSGIWEPVTQIHDGFYSLEKDSTDVIFIGSSQVFCNINPLTIWHDFGISSYDMTSSGQRIWISDYYVHEVLKYQKPKVIALEVGILFDDSPNDEDRNRKALDYMRFSTDKLKAIEATVKYSPDESFFSYLFPIMRFHTRWNQLAGDDFQYFSSDKHYFLRGYSPRYGSIAVPEDMWVLEKKGQDARVISIPERCRPYLDDIVAVCDASNVNLILFRTPSTLWSMSEHKCVDRYAAQNGIKYIDFNTLQREIQLNEEDFLDPNHMNVNGANKISYFFGGYLKDNYKFESAADDPLWQRDYEQYELYDAQERNAG